MSEINYNQTRQFRELGQTFVQQKQKVNIEHKKTHKQNSESVHLIC